MIASQRHLVIVAMLRRQGAASIAELAAALSVSAMTIRRDLDDLTRQGTVQRTYGGAALAQPKPTLDDPSFVQRAQIYQPAKRAIAKVAARQIAAGDRIILDSGSTVAALAERLSDQTNTTLITYSLPVVQHLTATWGNNLIFTGGAYDPSIRAFVGPFAEQILQDVRVDKAFLGATSVTLEDGFSNSNMHIVALQRVILRIARETYLLVDSHKFERVPFWLVAPLDQLTAIITDADMPPATQEHFTRAGVRVVRAEDDTIVSVPTPVQ